jgi:pyruvate,water dikinase
MNNNNIPTTETLIYSLQPRESAPSNDGAPSISQVGGKGLSLIDCCAARFPVPPGFVLSVAFFQSWLDSIKNTREWNNFTDDPSKQACDVLKEACIKLQLDPKQEEALNTALQTNFGSTEKLLVAVRSSSPEEDLAQASFAGGYETTLGVTRDTLLDAIRTSFASALDFRVVQYKLQNGLDILKPRIAVVVQQQLASDVSGVGFSLNPQNNCYDEAVISANFGLGETVVAGVVTPDTFVVDKVQRKIISRTVSDKKQAYVLADGGGIREEENAEPTASTLDDKQILEVASLVAHVEEHMGKPVDTEWAIQAKKLYLLQARPITVYLPLFPEMVTSPGEQKNLYMDLIVQTQGFSDSLSILGMDVWGRMLMKAKPFLPHGKDGALWEVNGREYIHVSNLLGTFGGETLVSQIFSVQGSATRRILDVVNLSEYKPDHVTKKNNRMMWARFKQLFRILPSFLYSLWNPEHAMDGYVQEVDVIMKRFGQGGTEEKQKNTMTFDQEVDSTMSVFERLVPKIGGIMIAYWSKWRLHKMFEGDSEVQDMLVTLNMDLTGNPTSEMGHAMLHLASFPEMQETQTGEEFVQRLNDKSYSSNFLAAYDDFMFKYGCRGIKEIDIATPRSYEDPADLFNRVKLIDVGNNQILTTKKRKQEAYDTLLEHAARIGKAKRFVHHANVIQQVGGYREHGKYMYVFMVAYLRRYALALGEQWAKEGRLNKPEDIFYLHVDEVTEAQDTPELDLKSLVATNRAPYEAVANVSDWPTVIDSRGKIFRAPREDVDDGLGGDPISPGIVRGRANVLKAPYEKPLESGEVLVTRATEPSWTPIFINAAAVVLEVGGPLQHGAIIAREYGIPCVSGVETATKVIKDGDLLEVDGTNGVVKIIDEESLNEDD